MGDGLLLEFPAVVDAVQCAIEMQRGVAARNAEALEGAQKAVGRGPHFPLGQRCLAQALAMLGQLEEAKAPLAEFLRLVPEYSYQGAKMQVPFKGPRFSNSTMRAFARPAAADNPNLLPKW